MPSSSDSIQWVTPFNIEEPKTKTKLWYHWLNVRFRQYMILEIFFVISLIMVLCRLQTISNQNDRVLEMVNSMHSRFGNMERKIESVVSQKSNQDTIQFDNTEPLEQSIADVLKNIKSPAQNSTEEMESVVPQVKQSTSNTAKATLNVPIRNETFRFNAADFLSGASVDNDHSSSSSLNPLIGYDQTNLVLLDRPEPPADKAWCTNDQNPVLTINLAKYIKPISVSYQHSKWNRAIPNGAPKIYDVVACLDFNCKKRKPLVSNCHYIQHESNKTEQMCDISPDLDVPLIGKLQFRFRENYGDTKMTCVHLVRVYGETTTPAKIEQKSLESEEICTDLRWYYYNSYFRYTWTNKNCTLLYKNDCCFECPGCCEECLISDYNGSTLGDIVENTFLGIVVVIAPLVFILAILNILSIINSMKSRFGNMERKIESLVSRKPNQDISPSDNTEPLEQSIANILKTMKFPKQDSTDKAKPIIIPQINQTTSVSEDSIVKDPTRKETFRFNAADYLRGASVDMDHSSSSNLNPIIGYDQTNLVLLDRSQPPADKAWCTTDKNPVLTINLAKYIKPIAVSYQHSKWNGTIPNGAPKIYDVVGCLDFYCEKWKPLVSNCEYSQYDSNEQMCNIYSYPEIPLTGKVQFRFRENYGGSKMTCVHLVRVYGETKTPAKIEEKLLESEQICTDLRWYYHNSYFKYSAVNIFRTPLRFGGSRRTTEKNCSVLYENSCCSECPECCQECVISDYNRKTFGYTCLGIFFGIVVLFFVYGFYKLCEPAIETAIWRAQNR